MLLSATEPELCSAIERDVLREAFYLEGVETVQDLAVDAASVVALEETIVPLDVTSHSALLQITAELSVDGCAEVLDEERAVWDWEAHDYFFCAYSHLTFQNAAASVDCEISIEFSEDGRFSHIRLTSVKLLNQMDICLSLDEAKVEEEAMSSNDAEDFPAEERGAP